MASQLTFAAAVDLVTREMEVAVNDHARNCRQLVVELATVRVVPDGFAALARLNCRSTGRRVANCYAALSAAGHAGQADAMIAEMVRDIKLSESIHGRRAAYL